MSTVKLVVGQQVLLTAVFKDANSEVIAAASSNSAPPPGVPQPSWAEDSKGTIIKLVQGGADVRAVSGAECAVVGVSPGTAHVKLTDGDSGKQVETEVIVAPSGVASVEIVVSAAEPTLAERAFAGLGTPISNDEPVPRTLPPPTPHEPTPAEAEAALAGELPPEEFGAV